MSDGLPKIDKSALLLGTLAGQSDERAYWLQKTPLERLEALEFLRQTMYGYDPATARLQRILEVIDLPRR